MWVGRQVLPQDALAQPGQLRRWKVLIEQGERLANAGGGGRDHAVQPELMRGLSDALTQYVRADAGAQRGRVEPDELASGARGGRGCS